MMNEQGAIKKSLAAMKHGRPQVLPILAAFMILAGLAEVVTGFTHEFFGITTSSVTIFTYSSVAIGVFYAAAGLLILTMRKRAATLAIILLCADIVGRVALVLAGLYPTTTLKNTLSLLAGTVIVAIIALYIAIKRKSFR